MANSSKGSRARAERAATAVAAALGLVLAACSPKEQAEREPSPAKAVPAQTAQMDAGAQDSELSPQQIERVRAMANAWPLEPSYTVALNVLDPSLSGRAAERGATVFDPADDYWGLPRTMGFDLVDLNCSGCHSLQIVMQQHATRERWNALLDWMVTEQGMMAMPEDERAVVQDYLVRHFGPETSAEEAAQ